MGNKEPGRSRVTDIPNLFYPLICQPYRLNNLKSGELISFISLISVTIFVLNGFDVTIVPIKVHFSFDQNQSQFWSTMKVSVLFIVIGFVWIVECQLNVNFGVKLPPFVLNLPRLRLPPIKISATFNHSPDSSPLKIRFPGISISSNPHDGWSEHQSEPEPEPEYEPYTEPEPEPEYEQLYHHKHRIDGLDYNRQTYLNNLAKSAVGSYHLQERAHRESWISADNRDRKFNHYQPRTSHIHLQQHATQTHPSHQQSNMKIQIQAGPRVLNA